MPHQRKCNRSLVTQARQSKRIVIPISREEYAAILEDTSAFKGYLDRLQAQHPELFPTGMEAGYRWYGRYPVSKKMPDVPMRRIRLTGPEAASSGPVFTLVPSFVMPYKTGDTEAVE